MKFEEIEIGECYSSLDDAVYKVLAKGEDWLCLLHYSYNHRVCNPELWKADDECIVEWQLVEENVFDELVYYGWQTLKPKDW